MQFFCIFSKPVEPDCLFDSLPNSLRPSSGSVKQTSDANDMSQSENQNKKLETGVYTPLTLIPPRVLPLLHALAKQMVQAGNQKQILKNYRYFTFYFRSWFDVAVLLIFKVYILTGICLHAQRTILAFFVFLVIFVVVFSSSLSYLCKVDDEFMSFNSF